MKKTTHNYTIVELLLVVAVIGILLGIGVAGVTRAMRNTGATGAIRNIGGRLSVARSFAVSSNQKVAVVFPMIVRYKVSSVNYIADPLDESGLFTSGQEETMRNKYLFRSLRVCVVEWDTSVTPNRYKFIRWCENDNWTFLPNGTYCNFYFDESSETNVPAFVYGVNMSSDGGTVSNSGTIDYKLGMPAIVYSSGGALDSNMGTPEINVVVFEDKFNAAVGAGSNKGTFMVNGLKPKDSNSKVSKGWKYEINPFTGLGRYNK